MAKTNSSNQWTAEEIDSKVDPILRKMEKAGILIDAKWLRQLAKDVEKDLAQLEGQIYTHAGQEFNINSPSQLAVILYDKLSLPTRDIAKTQKGFSTAASELEKLSGLHPIIECIFKYRELSKLKSTYLDTLPNMADLQGRLHTTYAQDTSTGRLSSRDPNLQNIPIRSEIGAEIRKAFIAPKGRKLVIADYSQIELRVAATLAHDERMIEAFNNHEDIHTKVAAEINSIPPDEVTKAQRRDAKTINFGIIYGVSAYGLAARTNMTVEEAGKYIKKYFDLYSGVRKYMDDTAEFAKKNGYVQTMFGRKREFPEINSPILAVSNAAKRAAINMPIQGTAADIMKIAMINVAKGLKKVSPESDLILQIHDELIIEAPAKDAKAVAKFLADTMASAVTLEVPIEVEAVVVDNWGEK